MVAHMSTIFHQKKKNNNIVFYFHNKGSSKYGTRDYMNVFHWCKYMEGFLLERPTLCIKAILHYGAKTCGVEMKVSPSMHYSGNFGHLLVVMLQTYLLEKHGQLVVLSSIMYRQRCGLEIISIGLLVRRASI
jgi:hypothetical protein